MSTSMSISRIVHRFISTSVRHYAHKGVLFIVYYRYTRVRRRTLTRCRGGTEGVNVLRVEKVRGECGRAVCARPACPRPPQSTTVSFVFPASERRTTCARVARTAETRETPVLPAGVCSPKQGLRAATGLETFARDNAVSGCFPKYLNIARFPHFRW